MPVNVWTVTAAAAVTALATGLGALPFLIVRGAMGKRWLGTSNAIASGFMLAASVGLVWQGVDPKFLIRDFPDRIYHVHMKDAAVNPDCRSGLLGSHLAFGDLRRAWNFRSLGHGSVNFEEIIRELNAIGYDGPLSVEWEDNGMEREFGAREACEFVKRIDFSPSSVAFDKKMGNR